MKSRYVFAGIITVVLVLVCMALIQVVFANDPGGWTKKWDGGGDGTTWGDADNWEGDVAPGSSDKVYIPAGSGVTISDARSVTWLHSDQPITIYSGGSLTLGACPSKLSFVFMEGSNI